jgi:hypothetical protein
VPQHRARRRLIVDDKYVHKFSAMMLRSPLSGSGFPAARPILADPRHIKLYARDGVPPEQRRGMAESA